MELSASIHVGAAALALGAGALALFLRKGARAHKQAGYVFVGAMIVMAIPAGMVSYQAGKPFDVLSSVLTCYMVLTGLLAFRSTTKPALVVLTCIAGMCLAGYLTLEVATQITGNRATDAPVGAGFVFATILALSVWGDFRRLRQPFTQRQMLVRHLWRMNFGLFMATVNLFGVRPHLFPEWMQTSGLLMLLAVAPVIAMAYWRIKLRAKWHFSL